MIPIEGVHRHYKAIQQDQELRPLLFSNIVRVLNCSSRRVVNNEELRDGAYGVSSLS